MTEEVQHLEPLAKGESLRVEDFIFRYFGNNKSAFARHMSTTLAHVNTWIAKGFIVSGEKVYSPRKDIPSLEYKLPHRDMY